MGCYCACFEKPANETKKPELDQILTISEKKYSRIPSFKENEEVSLLESQDSSEVYQLNLKTTPKPLSSSSFTEKSIEITEEIIKDSSFSLKIDLGDIIILQSLIRGFLERIKLTEYQSKKKENDRIENAFLKNNQKHPILPFENADPQIILDYSTPKTKNILSKLKPFTLKEETDKDLIKRGPTFFSDKSVYIGYWNTLNQRHGSGSQIWHDGSIYIGYWKNDKYEGKGRIVHKTGEYYDGDWLKNKANGQGVSEYSDGSNYTGDWKRNKKHGKGVEIHSNGDKYDGEFKKGKKTGFAEEWVNGDYYKGEFIKGLKNGQGTLIGKSGKKYTGSWVNGKMNGQGVFEWPDGKVYNGDFLNDRKQGFGTLCWPDNRKYEGHWHNDKKQGKGSYWTITGVKQGIWKNGRKIE